ncbi:Gp138 family membrane-puncturing spike protein [Citrobacter freundii]|uniref:Gp138 family membrane-puncturing spike protein n=1 Tax=Citrobacter freundii TaxID=546 RepID=UPI0019A13763|nr:Gp138 family membrane-puncturing spike protein [Enterobacteriaceae bacterium CA-0114]HAN2345319.1 translation initiation factor IF-2 [Escherichia coli]
MAQLRPVDDTEIFDLNYERAKSGLRVSLPGTIKSFDPESVTCEVELSTFGLSATAKRGSTSVDRIKSEDGYYPVIQDIPVVFPRGGGCTLTFPVKAGDECLVIFSDRCIDFWWQNGETQNTSRARSHSFSDAFVIPGPQSQAKKISNISTSAAQLRTDDGAAFVEVAAGGAVTITSPQITLNGPVQVNGAITSTGDQTANGISQINHTHGGVESGGSNTGKPQ